MLIRFTRGMLALTVLTSLMGCASYFKRKECEKTNWFSHGEQVAKSGGILENDQLLNECRRAEATIDESSLDLGFKSGRSNYCKPASVFQTGKRGEKFNADMCDGEPMRILQAKYADGLKEYCRPSNGMMAGQSGKPYQNVCSAEIERDFLPEFNKGRKKYLTGIIAAKEGEVQDIEQSARSLESKKRELLIRLAATPKSNVVVRDRTYDRNNMKETIHVEESESANRARTQIEQDLNSVDWQIRQKRREQEVIRSEIRKIQTELATL